MRLPLLIPQIAGHGEDRQGDQKRSARPGGFVCPSGVHGSISGEEHRGVIVHPAQGVEHGVQQAANHGAPSRLCSQTNQGACE